MTAPALRVEIVKAVRAPLAPAFLRGVLRAALAEPAVAAAAAPAGTEAALTVRVTGDRELRRLNREFLGEDHATDVLSFPSGEVAAPVQPGQTRYLGDVALSWPAVLRQSAAFGHDPDVEAALLCVHGLLHLLGWDHATPDEEREMTGLTLACLERSDLAPAPGRL